MEEWEVRKKRSESISGRNNGRGVRREAGKCGLFGLGRDERPQRS